MSEPSVIPEPERCEMCTEPPSDDGPILRFGPDDAAVDMGHTGLDNCFRRACEDVRTGHRAAHPIGTSVRA